MDAQQFLAEFGHFTSAPLGVHRLRELVKRLAVQGKLVAQDSREEPAPRFLERTTPESLGKNYQRTRGRSAPSSASNHGLPPGWALVRLDQLAHPQAGFAFKSDRFNQADVGLPIIRVRDVGVSRPLTFYSGDYRDEFLVSRGDWLVAMDGDFRVAMWDSDAALLNQRVSRLQFHFPEVSKKYVCLCLQFELLALQGVKNYTTVDHLSGGQIASARIPLPPIAEQHRIVAKCDELMELCDQLEHQQQDRRKLQNALRQSTLQALASAQSPHELKTSWQRLQANYGRLFSEPGDVNSVKWLLLNLAMRGLLVDQSECDINADTLLKSVDDERRRLFATKKIKASAAIPLPREDDLPYALPKRWTWARVSDLVEVCTGATPAKSEPAYYGGDVPWYTSSATNEKFARKPETFITQKALAETNCKVFPAGSLIVALYGQGKTRGQISEITVAGATNQAIAALVFFESSLASKRYIKYYFEKIYDEIRLQAEGGPQPNLNVSKIKETLIPIPPPQEQQRIANRLDELFSLCDLWQAQLKARTSLSEQLAAASVAALTGIAIEHDEHTAVKAPQTELIAPLRLATSPAVKAQAPLATILARHQGEMAARDLWQRFGGEIDAFYAQLKTEVAHGWIAEPEPARVRERDEAAA